MPRLRRPHGENGGGGREPLARYARRRRLLAKIRRDPEQLRSGPGVRTQRRRRTRATRAWPILAALAIGVAAGFVGALALGFASESQTVSRGDRRVHDAVASLHWSEGRAELLVADMPEPPVGEVYEVWLNRSTEAPQPTDALFTVTRGGRASVNVPGGVRGVREVMVTSEPLGGSASPTSAAVLRLRVAGSS